MTRNNILRESLGQETSRVLKKPEGAARLRIAMRAQGATTKAVPVRTVEEEQRSDRPQDAGALRVAGGAGPSAWLARLDDVLDIACGSPPSTWPRGACNAALPGFSAPC